MLSLTHNSVHQGLADVRLHCDERSTAPYLAAGAQSLMGMVDAAQWLLFGWGQPIHLEEEEHVLRAHSDELCAPFFDGPGLAGDLAWFVAQPKSCQSLVELIEWTWILEHLWLFGLSAVLGPGDFPKVRSGFDVSGREPPTTLGGGVDCVVTWGAWDASFLHGRLPTRCADLVLHRLAGMTELR